MIFINSCLESPFLWPWKSWALWDCGSEGGSGEPRLQPRTLCEFSPPIPPSFSSSSLWPWKGTFAHLFPFREHLLMSLLQQEANSVRWLCWGSWFWGRKRAALGSGGHSLGGHRLLAAWEKPGAEQSSSSLGLALPFPQLLSRESQKGLGDGRGWWQDKQGLRQPCGCGVSLRGTPKRLL